MVAGRRRSREQFHAALRAAAGSALVTSGWIGQAYTTVPAACGLVRSSISATSARILSGGAARIGVEPLPFGDQFRALSQHLELVGERRLGSSSATVIVASV